MAAAKLDAFLVPRADEHQGEYVPASAAGSMADRLLRLGRACAVIAQEDGALFVDGRYTVQARAEVDAGADRGAERAARPSSATGWPSMPRARRRSGSIRGCTRWPRSERLDGGAGAARHQAEADRPATSSTACGAARGPRRRTNPVALHPLKFAGPLGAGQDRGHPEAPEGRRAGRGGADAVRRDRLDCSTSAAPTSRIPGRARVCDRAGSQESPSCSSRPRRSTPAVRNASRGVRQDQRTGRRWPTRLKALRKAGKRVRLDPDAAAYWFARALGPQEHRARHRSSIATEGDQERGRDQGRARRAPARRRSP